VGRRLGGVAQGYADRLRSLAARPLGPRHRRRPVPTLAPSHSVRTWDLDGRPGGLPPLVKPPAVVDAVLLHERAAKGPDGGKHKVHLKQRLVGPREGAGGPACRGPGQMAKACSPAAWAANPRAPHPPPLAHLVRLVAEVIGLQQALEGVDQRRDQVHRACGRVGRGALLRSAMPRVAAASECDWPPYLAAPARSHARRGSHTLDAPSGVMWLYSCCISRVQSGTYLANSSLSQAMGTLGSCMGAREPAAGRRVRARLARSAGAPAAPKWCPATPSSTHPPPRHQGLPPAPPPPLPPSTWPSPRRAAPRGPASWPPWQPTGGPQRCRGCRRASRWQAWQT
jgi:hypothetical protein